MANEEIFEVIMNKIWSMKQMFTTVFCFFLKKWAHSYEDNFDKVKMEMEKVEMIHLCWREIWLRN